MAKGDSNTAPIRAAASPPSSDLEGETLPVQLAPDHIQTICSVTSALKAIEELIWNALDADATQVKVKLSLNDLGGLERIIVADNGHGLTRERCKAAFGSLGGSNKRRHYTTPDGRKPHGKYGRGRFKSFALGDVVTWKSRYLDDAGRLCDYSIVGTRQNLQNFKVGKEMHPKSGRPGMVVTIDNISINRTSLLDTEVAALKLTEVFALYLRQYPNTSVTYAETKLDPSAVEDLVRDYTFDFTLPSGQNQTAVLTIIEWRVKVDRALILCDANGFARSSLQAGIQAPGFEFTAYAKSPLVAEIDEQHNLDLQELHPNVNALVSQAKTKLKDHFRKRSSERTQNLVERWQEEEVYPYETTVAKTSLEQAERDVFNICAFKVQEFLPEFEEKDRRQKKLVFRLIKEAVETNPTSVTKILQEVLDLSIEQQDEFAGILDKTKLSSILSAATTVTRRLTFLEGLDGLLFDEHRASLNEPRQLQPILSSELWLFGEEYAIGVNEGSLKTALEKHIKLMGRETLIEEDVVDVVEGKRRRLDMLLYKTFPGREKGSYDYLVIELKRPSKKLDQVCVAQLKKYAATVMKDDRFDKSGKSKWVFMLIGNDVDETVETDRTQDGRPHGQVTAKGGMELCVKTWGEIKAEVKWRYEFFREQLEFEISHDDALEELRSQYPNLFPKEGEEPGTEETKGSRQ